MPFNIYRQIHKDGKKARGSEGDVDVTSSNSGSKDKTARPEEEKANEKLRTGPEAPGEGRDTLKEVPEKQEKNQSKGSEHAGDENLESAVHTCEECEKLGLSNRPAVRKVMMNGKETWLCETCLQSAGYEGEIEA